MANQYVNQMPEEVRDAVFGNVGTLISFRVGATDATFLVKEFMPVFSEQDLVNLDKYQIYIKLLIDGISSPAFSANTLPPVKVYEDYSVIIRNVSRQAYAKSRQEVEEQIVERMKTGDEELRAEAHAYLKGGLSAIAPNNHSNVPVSAPQPTAIERASSSRSVLESSPTTIVTPEPKLSEPAAAVLMDTNPAADLISDQSGGEIITEKKPPKEKRLKIENIIGDIIYKEQTAKGGVRWFIGEPIDTEKMAEQGHVNDELFKQAYDYAKQAK
jgi:hypothetical protein